MCLNQKKSTYFLKKSRFLSQYLNKKTVKHKKQKQKNPQNKN